MLLLINTKRADMGKSIEKILLPKSYFICAISLTHSLFVLSISFVIYHLLIICLIVLFGSFIFKNIPQRKT